MKTMPTVWVLTDGKTGDEQPLIGVAEALGVVPLLRHVRPRTLFAALMPFGPIDPRERPQASGSPLAPPWPDICLATGRRAVAYLRRLKRISPKTFTVFLKDPRTARHGADLLVVQAHDRPRGEGIMVVTTAPNRMLPTRLDAIRAKPPAALSLLPNPRVAVVVGGSSRHHQFTKADVDSFVAGLRARLEAGNALMITTSRRTPEMLVTELASMRDHPHVHFWDGTGENPYPAYLALADEVVVTADSTNMIGEAAATGRPISIFHPKGGHSKIDAFLEALSREAAVGRFSALPVEGRYKPINSTVAVAELIASEWRKSMKVSG